MKRTLQPNQPILIVDDEESILLSIDTILQMAGLNNLITCSDSRQTMAIIEQRLPGLVLLDLNMPHVNGEEIFDKIALNYPQIPVIIITGRIDAETAVSCMKSGVADYIVKPVDEEKLVDSVQKSLILSPLNSTSLEAESSNLLARLKHPTSFQRIITKSPLMLSIFQYIESIACTEQPVLIRGETGTGKELIAQAIHEVSGRRGDFVAVNVAGLDENVFSDTLFGHAKGAFTGADSTRPGLIEQAAEGTLFLDEIGDLAHGSQVKLLRLLQEGEYMPLGQDTISQNSARIIASTHVDLWALQQKVIFRQDLHYRLRTHRIQLPPLHARKEDLILLTRHFLQTAAETLKMSKPNIPQELRSILESYHFPGNIRELQAMIFDALAQHKSGTLALTVFREHIARTRAAEEGVSSNNQATSPSVPFTFADPLPNIKQTTRMLIEEALHRANNNQSTAATMLGISQQALSKRLKSWN